MVDPVMTGAEGLTRRPPVVEAGGHNRPVEGSLPVADRSVEVAGGSNHPDHRRIDRCLRGEGLLFRVERYTAEN